MALAVSQDETALLIKGGKTDPTVGSPTKPSADLKYPTCCCCRPLARSGSDGTGKNRGRGAGAAAPEPLAADALNDRLRTIRQHRSELRRRWQRRLDLTETAVGRSGEPGGGARRRGPGPLRGAEEIAWPRQQLRKVTEERGILARAMGFFASVSS